MVFFRSIYSIILVVIVLSLTQTSSAQYFYLNTSPGGVVNNKTYKLHVDSCYQITDSSKLTVTTCSSSQFIDDIALDNDSTLWFLTKDGELYKRKENDTNCQYVGKNIWTNTAMVADSVGNLYLAGGLAYVLGKHRSGMLAKYDGSNFSLIDSLPNGMFASGDLFFFEDRLFLTAAASGDDSLYIAELNINSPKHSCFYMLLDSNIRPYGAFTIKNENGPDRVFICGVHTPNFDSTSIIEIDIPNKKVVGTLCTYPFLVRGAASYYPTVWDSTTCPPPAGISNASISQVYFKVLYPVLDRILLKTNIENTNVRSIILYSLSGQKLTSFTQNNFPDNLDVSDIPKGLYILQVKTNKGEVLNQKVHKIQ